MILTLLESITRCSSSTSSPCSSTGVGSSRRVNKGYVRHHEATREDGEDVTAVFTVGGDSIPEAIHGGHASSAHTSPMSNSAPALKKHIMAQRNCFATGRATHGVVRR
jgi:hypothetical protein